MRDKHGREGHIHQPTGSQHCWELHKIQSRQCTWAAIDTKGVGDEGGGPAAETLAFARGGRVVVNCQRHCLPVGDAGEEDASVAAMGCVKGAGSRGMPASLSEGGVPIQPSVPKRSQAPFNKDNEIVIKLQDATANKVLEGKRPQEMTNLVNEYSKKMDDKRKRTGTARRLTSGDIGIIAANEEEAKPSRNTKNG